MNAIVVANPYSGARRRPLTADVTQRLEEAGCDARLVQADSRRAVQDALHIA